NFVSFSEFMQSGFIWALLSAVFYALTMLTSKTITKLSSYALTYIQTTVGIVILLPFIDFSLFDGLTSTNWFYILGTGFIHTGFVYYLFFDSIRSLSTILVSVLVFVDPVVAILLDMLLLDFMPSFTQTMGILLIFAGIFYTIYVPKKKRLPQEVS
ncbi:DMT family transporter, partial [Lysinibacillus capsici]